MHREHLEIIQRHRVVVRRRTTTTTRVLRVHIERPRVVHVDNFVPRQIHLIAFWLLKFDNNQRPPDGEDPLDASVEANAGDVKPVSPPALNAKIVGFALNDVISGFLSVKLHAIAPSSH